MTLWPLSLTRVTHGVPPVPNNTERLQAHRVTAPAVFANTHLLRNQPATLPECHSPDGGLVPLLSEVAR